MRAWQRKMWSVAVVAAAFVAASVAGAQALPPESIAPLPQAVEDTSNSPNQNDAPVAVDSTPADRILAASMEPPPLPPLAYVQEIQDAKLAWSARAEPAGAVLKGELGPSSRGPAVAALVSVLRDQGYWVSDETPEEYTEAVEDAVKAAQESWGLEADGKVGSQVHENLRASPAHVVSLLDRWAHYVQAAAEKAWSRGERALVVVNIPSARLRVLDLRTGETAVESRVIVGLPHRRTPRFETRITALRYNPSWYPPPSLLKIGRRYTPPGPNNPLGALLFVTNNNQNIYLHDTNEPELFEQPGRARSSGCIRVEAWKDLAAYISGFTPEHLDEQIQPGRTRQESIEPVAVLTTYSLVDAVDGRAAKYPDVYGLGDAWLDAALR